MFSQQVLQIDFSLFGNPVEFVEDQPAGVISAADSIQRPVYRLHVKIYRRRRGIDHMKQDVCFSRFHESGMKRSDKVVGQLANKTDGI